MAARSGATAMASPEDARKIVELTIEKLDETVRLQDSKFFPHGITSISITVKVAQLELSVSVAGPESKSGTTASGALGG